MNYLEQIDSEVLERIYAGRSLSEMTQITDWPTYFAGFIKRQAPNQAVLSALYATAEQLCWVFSFWFEMSAKFFLFEQAQSHINLLHSLNRLKLALCFTLEVGQSERSYDDSYELEACPWDIEQVNCVKRTMENFMEFSALVPEFQDDFGVTSALALAGTQLEAFYAFYPQFCKILDDNNFLHLTEKIVIPEMPELEVEMSDPNNYHTFEAFDSQKMATDFQGFVVGIVLAPGTEDGPRDLHNQWISKEEIEKAALHWSIHGRKIRIQHDESTEALNGEHPDFLCVFNWIQRGDTTIGGREVKDGTWLQAWQALSDSAKEKLYNRQITCFSPGSMMRVKRDK